MFSKLELSAESFRCHTFDVS